MADIDRKIYDILTSDTDTGCELNHQLFGDNEWSEFDRSKYLDKLRNNIEADSYQGGA